MSHDDVRILAYVEQEENLQKRRRQLMDIPVQAYYDEEGRRMYEIDGQKAQATKTLAEETGITYDENAKETGDHLDKLFGSKLDQDENDKEVKKGKEREVVPHPVCL